MYAGVGQQDTEVPGNYLLDFPDSASESGIVCKIVSTGVSGIGGQTGMSDLPAGRLLPFLKTNIQNNKMIERYLTQTQFSSEEDFREHLHFIVPDTFNFAYDVMDEWAKEAPDKLALLWTSERGEEVKTTFAGFKEQTDRTAAYFLSLGISRGDKVMLILKRHYQWWLAMMALCKIGAVAIPATHMLTKKDIVYRNRRASVKAIICVNDEYVTTQVR